MVLFRSPQKFGSRRAEDSNFSKKKKKKIPSPSHETAAQLTLILILPPLQ
jgi:hypothetical protein